HSTEEETEQQEERECGHEPIRANQRSVIGRPSNLLQHAAYDRPGSWLGIPCVRRRAHRRRRTILAAAAALSSSTLRIARDVVSHVGVSPLGKVVLVNRPPMADSRAYPP